jgi:hypothetical protein
MMTSAAREVVWASRKVLANAERSNSDIIPLRNEEQEGYGIFQLALGVRERLFGGKSMENKYSKALTIMAVANRVEPAEARDMFLFLYASRDDDRLREMALYLRSHLQWPTAVDYRVGLTVCISLLLRQYWFKNAVDYDPQWKAMSPTAMSRAIGMPVDRGSKPNGFLMFQNKEAFPMMRALEVRADDQIKEALIDKGFLGG